MVWLYGSLYVPKSYTILTFIFFLFETLVLDMVLCDVLRCGKGAGDYSCGRYPQ